MRSPIDVADEIEEVLSKYHPKTFEFVDSVFNDPLEHSTAILEEIVRRPWKAHFTAMGMLTCWEFPDIPDNPNVMVDIEDFIERRGI